MAEPTPRERLLAALSGAREGLVGRESLVELIGLAAIAGEHVLVIGPPGTAKSEAVRRVARALGGGYFEYLLGRFTEPTEIFGPVDLQKLKDGIVETQTKGMLPEAEIAFLDEVFLGSSAILNTLLQILNERTFRRGHTIMQCPLRVCVGASNALPTDESVAAFADRFLVRVFLESVPDPNLEELLEGGWTLGKSRVDQRASIAIIDELSALARAVELADVRTQIAHAVRLLRSEGIALSDRRVVRTQKLVAAAAAAAGRSRATTRDLWPIVFAVPTAEEQWAATDRLREILSSSESSLLASAALDASQGLRARATRITEAGQRLLRDTPDPKDTENWKLKLEGIAREIDAGFPREALTPELADVRSKIAGHLRPVDRPTLT